MTMFGAGWSWGLHVAIMAAMVLSPAMVLTYLARGFARDAVDTPGYDEGVTAYATAVRRAWLAGIAAFGVLVLVLAWYGVDTPRANTAIPLITFLSFHAIWWPIGAPVMNRVGRGRNPEDTAADPPVRRARLKPRRVSDDLPAWLTVGPLLLCAIGIAVIAKRLQSVDPIPSGVWWPAGGAIVVAIASVVWLRWEVRAPQRVFGSGDEADAYEAELESHRRFRVRAVALLQTAFVATLFVAAYGMIELAAGRVTGETLGLIGGVGGSLVGIGGGVFGTVASRRAQRIQALRARLVDATES